MPNTQINPSTSASSAEKRKSNKPKVQPFPTSNGVNGKSQTASPAGRPAGGVVPPSAGARIPIDVPPLSDMSDNAPRQKVAPSSAMPKNFPGAAAIPNVMTPEFAPQPDDAPETVQERVSRLRPRSIRMQFRYVRTLLFMLWLFGRLVFWQAYVARYFPGWVNGNNARRWQKYAGQFRNFAIDMGGVMIKAGQFASTRADILPEEVIMALADLQDKVPTIPYERIRAVLDEELNDPDSIYDWIDAEPIAAASLGQVHRAKLKTGERVVIKVQRPGVRHIVYTDMAALFIVAKVAMRFNFIRRRADAVLIVDEFGRVLLEEVNYIKEVENAERFQAMFAEDTGVYVPATYSKFSTDRIITIEDVTSIKIDDYTALEAAGIDRKEVAKRLMDTYMQQIFEDRFFHADPHPGNLFIYPLPVDNPAQYVGKGGRPFYLIFIDFGMTGTLTPEISRGLVNTLTAVLTRDAAKLVQAYQQLGFILPGAETRRIEEATRLVFDEVWGMSMTEMTSMDFEAVSDIGKQFSDLLYDMPFRVPQDFVYLGRTVGILSGMATALDPDFNPWTEIQYYVQRLITTDEDANIFTELSETLRENLNEIIADGPQGLIRVAQRVLNQFNRMSRVEQLLQQIINGDVEIQTRMSTQHRRQLERIESQGKRTSRMVLIGSLIIASTLFYTNGDQSLAIAGFVVSGTLYVSTWFIR